MAVTSNQKPSHHSHGISPVLEYPLQAWVVVISAALFFFYEFIQMTMFNVIAPELMQTFNVSAQDLGHLSAMYFYANVCCIFIVGVLLDRFSTRKLLTIAMVVSVISTYLFALSHSFILLGVCRFVTGMASSFCVMSCVRLASRWFPLRRVALVVGMVITMAMLGGMFGQTPMSIMTHYMGWRHAVLFNATFGAVLAIILGSLVRDYPKSAARLYAEEKQELDKLGFWPSIMMAMKNKQNWLAGIYTNLLSLPVIVLGAMWGVMYLTQARHLPSSTASYITSMIFLGTIFGSPILGWWSDHIGLRKMPMIVGALLSLVIVLFIMYCTNLSVGMLMILFFLLAFITSIQVVAYPLVIESNPFTITSAAEGVTCTLIMLNGAIFQPLYGYLMDSHWDGTMNSGLRIYSSHAYLAAMWILPIAFIVATVLAFCIKETYGKDLK
jgi:sugar phosphate permease